MFTYKLMSISVRKSPNFDVYLLMCNYLVDALLFSMVSSPKCVFSSLPSLLNVFNPFYRRSSSGCVFVFGTRPVVAQVLLLCVSQSMCRPILEALSLSIGVLTCFCFLLFVFLYFLFQFRVHCRFLFFYCPFCLSLSSVD